MCRRESGNMATIYNYALTKMCRIPPSHVGPRGRWQEWQAKDCFLCLCRGEMHRDTEILEVSPNLRVDSQAGEGPSSTGAFTHKNL